MNYRYPRKSSDKQKYLLLGLVIAVCAFGFLAKGLFVHGGLWAEIGAPSTAGSPEYEKNLHELLDIVNKQNPLAALQELSARMQTSKVVFENCHVIAHALGRAAYKKYNDFSIALLYQDTVCSDGYMHGVIEAKFASIPDTATAIAQLKTVCSKYSVADRCWHGTGHGLMFFTQDDLPKSLNICNKYSISRARSRCWEGVFMENFLSDPDSHPSNYVNAQNPFTTCTAVASQYKATCYFYLPVYYLGLHQNDYAAALNWCQKAEAGYALSCVRGVGSLAIKYNINDPKAVEQLCKQAGPGNVSSCIDGMVSYYLTFSGSTSKTAAICPQLEAANQKTCYASLKRRVPLFEN